MTKIEQLGFHQTKGQKMKIYMLTNLNLLKKTSMDKTFDKSLIKFKSFQYQVLFDTFATTCHNVLKIAPINSNLLQYLPENLGILKFLNRAN